MVVCRASSKVGNWGACSGRSGPRARRRQCPNCVCAVCWGGAIRTPYPPAPQSPPPPHREWRCIGGGAATIAAAVTATVAATGTAALQRRRRGARHQPRRTAGGQATAVPASRALVVSLRRLPCPGQIGSACSEAVRCASRILQWRQKMAYECTVWVPLKPYGEY